MQAITSRREEIAARVAGREEQIQGLLEPPEATKVEIVSPREDEGDAAGEERVEAIRRSVAVPTDAAGVVRAAEATPIGGDTGTGSEEVDRG
jgi:hypothetical protein